MKKRIKWLLIGTALLLASFAMVYIVSMNTWRVDPEAQQKLDQIESDTGPGSDYCENWPSVQALPPSCE